MFLKKLLGFQNIFYYFSQASGEPLLPAVSLHRPSSFMANFTLLLLLSAFAAAIVVFILNPLWYTKMKSIESHANSYTGNFISELQSEIRGVVRFTDPMKTSSASLSRFLNSNVNYSDNSFSDIENKVAPLLFLSLKTTPRLSQISYISRGGLFFSYYMNQDQTFAIYSNATSAEKKSFYFLQNVTHDTGKLSGKISISHPFVNTSWYEEALNNSNGYSALGTSWHNPRELLFLSSSRTDKRGVISMGFPVASLTSVITSLNLRGGSLHWASEDGRVLIEGLKNIHVSIVGDSQVLSITVVNSSNGRTSNGVNISCREEKGILEASVLRSHSIKYTFYCSPINIMGIESVYVLAFPQNQFFSFVQECVKNGVIFLVTIIFMTIIIILDFLFVIIQAARREMCLCFALIKQMEATQQAERKSMNKSVAIASASHDIRASLLGLTGLIEESQRVITRYSDLGTNLAHMETCANNLLGLLNSILDTSKVEAGKMQLVEEEFDLAEFLEQEVDLYHPTAMRKGVDVILDPCDGSVIKFPHVKGDKGKLHQIISNLLSNAVKFTDKGHITVRGWIQKPSLENSIISQESISIRRMLCLFRDNKRKPQDIEEPTRQDPKPWELVVEVDDTGRGIPKEKQKAVFENYVQVKETNLEQGGTGLGLGIVQSLVHLMRGDISIVDKDIGEQGTCFRFNVPLTLCDNPSDCNGKESNDDLVGERNRLAGLTIRTCDLGSGFCSPSPRLRSSPKAQTSWVVLFLQNKERMITCQRFMESLRINVKVVKKWEHLSHQLKKIKQKQSPSQQSSGKSNSNSNSLSGHSSSLASKEQSAKEKELPLSSLDGVDYASSTLKKTAFGAIPTFILLVVDTNVGPFMEICKIIAEFRRGISNPLKVVWLGRLPIDDIGLVEQDMDMFDEDVNVIISHPFHGTRLYEVIKLLPEFGGGSRKSLDEERRARKCRDGRIFNKSLIQEPKLKGKLESSSSLVKPLPSFDPRENAMLTLNKQRREDSLVSGVDHSPGLLSKAKNIPPDSVQRKEDIQEFGNPSSSDKPLSGKTLLLVEDDALMRKLAAKCLERLGANVEQCMNGEEAVELVHTGLQELKTDGVSIVLNLPYDYILMDCQMPVMDGFEATRQIRKMELQYGVHIPIIALSAHTSGLETTMTIDAGMDIHLGKPINGDRLLRALSLIHN